MSSHFSLSKSHRSRSGVALVIVLAFVLLLTGLVVAFFSRTISERQISNSSANQVKVDALAQNAVSTVIGDLQQEIAAGSTPYPLPSPTPTQGGATIFAPKVAATMVPAPVLPSPTPVSGVTGLENLLKQSAGGQPFYSGSNYDTANYPASKRAAKSTTGTGAAGNNSTNKASLSGRFISSARWNRPLLMPAASATDSTPKIASGGNFIPPDWVLVTRDGANPITWSKNLTASTTTGTAVVGRYAYNLYDEGGLLDANVAGYPAGAYPADTSTPAPTPLPTPPTRKSSLAYADLTVPVTTNGVTQPLLTAKQINALVGWRNYASSQPSGSFPNYQPAATPGTSPALTSFDISTLLNTNGYLAVSNGKLYNGASDRMFGSRQQLINFLLQGVAATDAERVRLQNSLQYLGTYSRSLAQPSFIPDPNRPKVLPSNFGGNNAGGLNLEDAINPNFLTVRVKTTTKATTTAGRFDGSDLIAGEPLVKKRFNLNRLAWLTYLGPSANNMTSQIVKSTIIALSGTSNTNDPAYQTALQFVQQGTAANIKNYFGLQWSGSGANKRWEYNVHNSGGATGSIRKLDGSKLTTPETTDVLHANREADFFELLKASINVGSLGKAATTSNPTSLPGGNVGEPYQSQFVADTSVDQAIIQIGANIIDQFDLDGYPTWLHFNDGGSTAGIDVHGIENLPYLSGIKHALVKVKQADPTINSATGYITNTGVGAMLQCPELWNPHDYNTNNLDQTAGVVGPTKFRVYAASGNTAGVNSNIKVAGVLRSGSSNGSNQFSAILARSPGYQTPYGFSFVAPESKSFALQNTELDFEVARDATAVTRFREPTILCQLTPNGYVTNSPPKSYFGIVGRTAGFFVGNAFRSDVDSGITGVPPTLGSGYVGFYLGAVPLLWSDGRNSPPIPPNVWLDNVTVDGTAEVHYILQYQDASGSWVPYDEKDRTIGGSATYSENATVSAGGDKSTAGYGWSAFLYPRPPDASATDPNDTNPNSNYPNGQWDSCYMAMDPRTSRFHLMKFTAGKYRYWAYPPYSAPYAPNSDQPTIATRTATSATVGFKYGWIDSTKGITLAFRNGINDGAALFCPVGLFPTSMGWNPGSVDVGTAGSFVAYGRPDSLTLGPATVTGLHICRPGMFSQNNPYARRSEQALGDNGDTAAYSPFSVSGGQSNAGQSYSDPDGVVRRASGGLVPFPANLPATTNVGLPMTAANTTGITRLAQSDSRPVILNRPFRTVGELAYTFSGTPWKNLNFTMPESGDSALLDVFSVNDTDDSNGLVAGKVNLNTRLYPVLQAIIAGAYKDESNPGTAPLGSNLPTDVAKTLSGRTTSPTIGKGPLQNVSELVGRFNSKIDANTDAAMTGVATVNKGNTFSPKSYTGFSADLVNNIDGTAPPGVLVTDNDANNSIPRFANATIRALSASGQTRVWNLMVDVIAQTGRYPTSATAFEKFSVEAEQRYWVHLAVDRLTGQVIDEQVEVVKE